MQTYLDRLQDKIIAHSLSVEEKERNIQNQDIEIENLEGSIKELENKKQMSLEELQELKPKE